MTCRAVFGVDGRVSYFFDHIVVVAWIFVDKADALWLGRLSYFMKLPKFGSRGYRPMAR
jgi:hypothetical protein